MHDRGLKMKSSVLLAVTLLLGVASAVPLGSIRDVPEDATLDMIQYLTKYGYPSENHTVQTADGYLLRVYRIPYGVKCGQDQVRKSPVLLQHGLLSNSIDFINSGVENGLGFILADNCYDVWIGNSRGNFESKNHISMTPDEDDFWKFSWHEMGKYDIPAVIDYILKNTGEEQIQYIGHSQGTTQFFVYASLYPEESHQKVKGMHALAPVAYMGNMTSPIFRWAADHLGELEVLLNVLGWNQFLPQADWVSNIAGNACNDQHPNLEQLCTNLLFLLCGFDSVQMNDSLVSTIGTHDPAGASVTQVLHYGQEIESDHFRQYDHGTLKNLIIYGSPEPPRYEIEKIKVPLYLHYGENDWLASVLDVERFAAETPTSVLLKVPFPQFNHLDFLWAIDVKTLLYNDILAILDQDL